MTFNSNQSVRPQTGVNVLTAISAVEYARIPPAAGDMKVGTAEVSRERRQEFASILSHAIPRFRRLARRSLRNAEDAEDAVQEALLLAFRHIAQFDGRAQMSTWITAILNNTVRMKLRRDSRVQMQSLDENPEEGQRAISDLLADSRPTPEQALEQRELRELAVKVIGSLPTPQQAALRLRLRDEVSIRNAAETLGVPEGTLKAQLNRGRATLMQRFHRALGTPKAQIPDREKRARRKTYASRYEDNRAQGMAHLPVTNFREPGGCESLIGV